MQHLPTNFGQSFSIPINGLKCWKVLEPSSFLFWLKWTIFFDPIFVLFFVDMLFWPANIMKALLFGRPSIHGTGTPWILGLKEILLVPQVNLINLASSSISSSFQVILLTLLGKRQTCDLASITACTNGIIHFTFRTRQTNLPLKTLCLPKRCPNFTNW